MINKTMKMQYVDKAEKINIYVVNKNGDFYYVDFIEYRVKKFTDLHVEGRNLYGLDTFNDYSVDEDSQVIVAPALSTNEINVNSKKLTLKRVDLGK
ncbi:MAG: hypothetical protein K6G76_01950 [Lachnospiraceae bacterium]|nr:hypothetical protein [Lachnospiraceae bacterium]